MSHPIVSVVPLGHELPEIPTFTAKRFDVAAPWHILVVLIGRGLAAENIDNLLNYFILPRLKDDIDGILFRVHPSSLSDVRRHLTVFGGVVSRYPQTPVGIVMTSAESRGNTIEWVTGSAGALLAGGQAISDADVVEFARDAEFSLFSQRPAALLPATDHFHYEGPNGAHYRSYFRGGMALSLRDYIDGFAFWTWHHVCPGSLIVVDNPSLLAAGLGIADYARRELALTGDEVPFVEARDSYGEPPDILASRLEALARGTDQRVVVLSSIASTGDTLSEIARACNAAGFEDVQHLVLFGSADKPEGVRPIHELEVDLSREDSADCACCLVQRLPVVQIRPDTNLVEVSALVTQAKITITTAAGARDFFSRYGDREDLVSVHRNQHDARRHHVIDIRVGRLCSVPAFEGRLREKLAPYKGRRVVVLHPRHDDATALAISVATFLGADRIAADPKELGGLPGLDRTAIRAADILLVVDDAAITGSRMRQYRAQLNATKLIDTAGAPAVGAVFGVLRPASPARRQGILDMIDWDESKNHLVVAVEEMLLPDWQGADCPWCDELAQLDSVELDEGSLLWHRREDLHSTSAGDGLVQNLFLPWSAAHTFAHPDDGLLPPDPDEPTYDGHGELELGPRSILGNLRTEAQVFIAVASSLQTLRAASATSGSEPCLSETYTSPISRVLAPESYMSGRFYAPVILGAILRAARRYDLRATAVESFLRRQVGERMTDPSPAVRAEMIYAIGQGKLARPSELADPTLLAGCDHSVLHFLRALGALPSDEPLKDLAEL